MKKILIFLILFLITSSAYSANEDLFLKPFFTDGCTHFVDGTRGNPKLWEHCCFKHDLRYWFGGDQVNMDETDLKLKTCVGEAAGPLIAELMYKGIRLGHYSPVKNKTKWGWGWTPKRENLPLTNPEIKYITSQVMALPYDSQLLEKFIAESLKESIPSL